MANITASATTYTCAMHRLPLQEVVQYRIHASMAAIIAAAMPTASAPTPVLSTIMEPTFVRPTASRMSATSARQAVGLSQTVNLRRYVLLVVANEYSCAF